MTSPHIIKLNCVPKDSQLTVCLSLQPLEDVVSIVLKSVAYEKMPLTSAPAYLSETHEMTSMSDISVSRPLSKWMPQRFMLASAPEPVVT